MYRTELGGAASTVMSIVVEVEPIGLAPMKV